MPLDSGLIQTLARSLAEAAAVRTVIDPLTSAYPHLSIEDAYRIQAELVRQAKRPVVGIKAALTSAAKQRAMGVDQPGFGILLEGMEVGQSISRRALIHPRVEPEIALFFRHYQQTGELLPRDIPDRISGFAPALEVIDSRYRDFKFTAADVYADNCSSASFIVSHERRPPDHPGLESAGVIMERNGEIVQTGTPAAVLGHPYRAAAFILNLAFGMHVQMPGSFVLLTGGITDAVAVDAGDVIRADFAGIGTISLSVTD